MIPFTLVYINYQGKLDSKFSPDCHLLKALYLPFLTLSSFPLNSVPLETLLVNGKIRYILNPFSERALHLPVALAPVSTLKTVIPSSGN